jgi:hypothetical protein
VIYRIRCSALPAAFACPASVLPTEVEIDPVSEPADEGSANHDVMRMIVEMDARSLDGIDVVAAARRHEVDEDDTRIQAFISLAVWKQLRGSFPDAQAEVELSADFELGEGHVLRLDGHLDALAVDRRARRANIGDWKYGRVDRSYVHQIRGYQAITLANYPDVDLVHGFVGWMRERDVENYSMTRDQLWEWVDEVRARLLRWDGVYHPGPQCAHCRANHVCPALREMARRDVAILGGDELAAQILRGLADLPDAEVVGLRRRAKVLEKAIGSLNEAIRMRVEAAGGVLRDGAGRELRMVEQGRRRIDPALAWPVLQARLTDEELLGCVEIKPSLVDDAIAAKTERGQKKKAIEEMSDALKAANAVTDHTTRRLNDMRTKETKT